jgi:hydroxyacylglutathione hydrolase
MFLRQIFDPYLAQYAYLIGCQKTGEAVIIDPLRDIDTYRDIAAANNLRISAVAETHIHADFVSGAREFATDPSVHLYLSAEGGPDWSYGWPGDRSKVTFLHHEDDFMIGNIRIQAVHSPGHTPEHLSYLITDQGGGADTPMAIATGDFLFVGDVGRPDLLETAAGFTGSMRPAAERLASSLRERLQGIDEYVQVLPGHGAGSACGKSLGAVPVSTLGYEGRFNKPLIQARGDVEAFVDLILTGQPEPPPYFARMKQVNRDGIQVTGGLPDAPRLSAEAFAALEGPVLDARDSTAEFAAGHFPGALAAPLRSPYFSVVAGSYTDPDHSLRLVLEREEDLDLALRQLYRIGYDKVAGWITADELPLTAKTKTIQFGDWDGEAAAKRGEVLDVRTAAEFEAGHLPGAVNIPYTRLKVRLDELPAEPRPLYIHCGSGKRAAMATAFLQSLGHDVIHVNGTCEACERIAEAKGMAH